MPTPFQIGWGGDASYVNPQWFNNNGVGNGSPQVGGSMFGNMPSPPPTPMFNQPAQQAQQMPMDQMAPINQGVQSMAQYGGGMPGQTQMSGTGMVDQNMDGIDDRIFQSQMKQLEMQSQSEMQQLQAKRQEEYWSAMKDRMVQQQKMQQQAMQNSMMNQPVGQFGQQAANQQKVTQLGLGTQHAQMQNTFADGFGAQQSKSRPMQQPQMTSGMGGMGRF